jgi:LysR family positive regulator for ilvC
MNNQDLKNFTALAKTLHFAKAARQVHISPSALTRAIQRLESEVNQELFSRDKRTVLLTEAGRIFLEYAEKTLSEWERCKTQLESQTSEVRGTLSIYSSVTAVYSLLAEILTPFQSRYPDVAIKLSTGDVADALDRVLNGDVNCAIAALPDKLPVGINFLNLVTTPLLFIAPLGSSSIPKLRDNGSINWEQTPLILPERDLSRQRQDSWFIEQKVTPQIFAEIAGNEAIIAMVSLGFGVGVVPELVLSGSPMKDKVRVLDVSPPLAPYSVGIAYKSSMEIDGVVGAFREVAKEQFSL